MGEPLPKRCGTVARALCLALLLPVRVLTHGDCQEPAAAGNNAAVAPHGATHLTTRLRLLFSQWKALPSTELAAKGRTFELGIDSALADYVASELSGTPLPSAEQIEHKLNTALAAAAWEVVFGLSPADAARALRSNRPSFTFLVRGASSASDLYVAGFSVGWGNVYAVFIHGFAPQGGKYRAVGELGGEMDSAIPRAFRLRSFAPHELRFLVWGLHIGSPEGLTTIALYKFDGKGVTALWLRRDVPAAQVTLDKHGLVIIESHTHVFTKDATTFPYARTYYRQTITGLHPLKVQQWTEH